MHRIICVFTRKTLTLLSINLIIEDYILIICVKLKNILKTCRVI